VLLSSRRDLFAMACRWLDGVLTTSRLEGTHAV